MRCGTASLSVPPWRHEGRPNPGSARSCLTSIRYSVRHVQQDQDQAFLLRCHLFSLTCLTSLTCQNRPLPGIFQNQVQITLVTAALDAGVPLRDVQEAASHTDPRTTIRYDRARGSLDRHPTYIVAAYIAGAARLSVSAVNGSAWRPHRQADNRRPPDDNGDETVTDREHNTNANRRSERKRTECRSRGWLSRSGRSAR